MSTFVPNYEERYYQVHPSQLPWAMHQLRAISGFQIHHYEIGANGMAVILVYAPIGAPDTDWRASQAPRRRRWPRFDWARIGRGLALAVIALALAYIAYGLFVDAASQPTQAAPQATTEPSLWDRIGAALPHGEPVVEHTAPAIEMPWDAAGRQAGEVVDGVVRILTAGFVAAALAGLVFAAFKVRGGFKK